MLLQLMIKCCLSRRDTKNSETGSNPKLALFNREIKRQMKEALNRLSKINGYLPKGYLTEMGKVKIMYSDGNQTYSIKKTKEHIPFQMGKPK